MPVFYTVQYPNNAYATNAYANSIHTASESTNGKYDLPLDGLFNLHAFDTNSATLDRITLNFKHTALHRFTVDCMSVSKDTYSIKLGGIKETEFLELFNVEATPTILSRFTGLFSGKFRVKIPKTQLQTTNRINSSPPRGDTPPPKEPRIITTGNNNVTDSGIEFHDVLTEDDFLRANSPAGPSLEEHTTLPEKNPIIKLFSWIGRGLVNFFAQIFFRRSNNPNPSRQEPHRIQTRPLQNEPPHEQPLNGGLPTHLSSTTSSRNESPRSGESTPTSVLPTTKCIKRLPLRSK